MSKPRIVCDCYRCMAEREHIPEWRQRKKDWRVFRLYLRCVVCGRLKQCPKFLHEKAKYPLPDIAAQKELFPV
jgi:hypothetical protein